MIPMIIGLVKAPESKCRYPCVNHVLLICCSLSNNNKSYLFEERIDRKEKASGY